MFPVARKLEMSKLLKIIRYFVIIGIMVTYKVNNLIMWRGYITYIV